MVYSSFEMEEKFVLVVGITNCTVWMDGLSTLPFCSKFTQNNRLSKTVSYKLMLMDFDNLTKTLMCLSE